MQPYGLGKENEEAVFGIYAMEVQPRLIRCMEISNKISQEVESQIEEVKKNGLPTQSDGRVVHLPHIQQPNEDIETFLYNAKSALRDIAKIFEPLFREKFEHSRYNEIYNWAKNKFGEDSPLSKLLATDQDWIKDIVRRRNAVEHPGGHSGHLHICNFEFLNNNPNKGISPPCWYRNDDPKSLIHTDLPVILDNILNFSEDILATSLIQTGSKFPLVIYEVPEEERDPKMPVRLRVTVDMSKLKLNTSINQDAP